MGKYVSYKHVKDTIRTRYHTVQVRLSMVLPFSTQWDFDTFVFRKTRILSPDHPGTFHFD